MPGILNRRDALLELKANEYTNKAIKAITERPPSPPPYIPKRIRSVPLSFTDTPEAISNLVLRDLAFEAQSDAIANNAVITDLNWKPSKIQSHVTQAMIEDYQARQAQPVLIAGVSYKYHPSSVPLDLEVPAGLGNVLDAAGVLHFERIIKDSGVSINRLEKEQIFIETQKKNRADQYDLDMGAFNVRKTAVGITQKQLNREIKEQNKYQKKYDKDMGEFDKQIANTLAEIDIQGARIGDAKFRLDESVRNKASNAAEIYRVSTINQGKLKAHEADLNELNKGQFVMEQRPGESDNEYRLRLIQTGVTTLTKADVEGAANLENIVIGKRNLNELISNVSECENIVKMLTNDELFLFNKRFVAIKKKYLETYGKDNKQMKDSDVAAFIRDEIANKVLPAAAIAAVVPPPAAAPVVAVPMHQTAKDKFIQLATDNGLRPRGTIVDIAIMIIDAGIPISIDLAKSMRKLDFDAVNDHYKASGAAGPVLKASGIKSHGISVKEYPPLMKFGKIHIAPDNLYYRNILKIRNISRKALVGFPDTRVSEALATLILKILDGGHVNKSDLSVLHPKEKHMFDTLMMMSGLHKTHDNTMDVSSQEMKHRLALIDGEISSGNNNIDLLKEAHKLLHSMARAGMCSNNSAAAHYKTLKSFF